MKLVLLSIIFVLATSAGAKAHKTLHTSAQAPATSTASVFSNNSAMIVLPGSTQILTPTEAISLQTAMYNVFKGIPDLATAQKALTATGASIAAAHGALAAGPYNITGDFSVQITLLPANSPPAWVKVANENQTVLIKTGTIVRFGAHAGTVPGNDNVKAPLTQDSFDQQVTFQADTVVTVNSALFGGLDPAPNYVKELDMFGITGGVTVVSAN